MALYEITSKNLRFDKDFETSYSLKKKGNGVYAFVLKGNFNIGGVSLSSRDGLGISSEAAFTITADTADAEILLMEVPMRL